jgi:hypothetical protein
MESNESYMDSSQGVNPFAVVGAFVALRGVPLGLAPRSSARNAVVARQGDRLQSYMRPLVWSACAPGQDGIRAPGANRCSVLEGRPR